MVVRQMIVDIVVEHRTASSVRYLPRRVLIGDENFSNEVVMRTDHVRQRMSHVLSDVRKDVGQDLMLIHLWAMF